MFREQFLKFGVGVSIFLIPLMTCAKDVVITDLGAKGDGVSVNTEIIQKAIDKASAKGDRVVVPWGEFVTGTLVLKDHTQLYLSKGAKLLGSTNPDDYSQIEYDDMPKSPKEDDNSKLALLLAHDAQEISIEGEGTIDGRGRELALTIDRLHHEGVRIDPHYDYGAMRPRETSRPKIIHFSKCCDVKVQGITIRNSACWVQTYELCKNLHIEKVNVESRAFWNNDGMDITDCEHVMVDKCNVNSADDGICLKSYYPDCANSDVTIKNCVIRSSASAIKFGTASVGGFEDVVIDSIKVMDTFRSAVAIESVDGAYIRNVSVSNVEAFHVGNALFVRLGNRMGNAGNIKGVRFRDIYAEISFDRPDSEYDMRGPALGYFHNIHPAPIVGIEGNRIEDVSLKDVEIVYPGRSSKGMAYIPTDQLSRVPEATQNYPEYSMFGELPSWGFFVRHVEGIDFENVRLRLKDGDYRPALILDDVKGYRSSELRLPRSDHPLIIKHHCM